MWTYFRFSKKYGVPEQQAVSPEVPTDSSTNSNVANHWPGNEVLKIQQKLQQDIQAAKTGRFQDDDANSDMSNT